MPLGVSDTVNNTGGKKLLYIGVNVDGKHADGAGTVRIVQPVINLDPLVADILSSARS